MFPDLDEQVKFEFEHFVLSLVEMHEGQKIFQKNDKVNINKKPSVRISKRILDQEKQEENVRLGNLKRLEEANQKEREKKLEEEKKSASGCFSCCFTKKTSYI